MAAIAGITAASAALVFVALPDPPAIEPAAETDAQGGLGEILRGPALWPLLPLAFVGYAFVIAIRSLWIAPYLGEVHGFDATQRGNAALVMAIAMSLGALAYGPLERALASPKLTTLIGSLLTGACLVALGLLGETSATLAVTLLAVIGAAGLTYAILMAHARLFFPARLLGRGVTFMNFVVIGGAGIVQWFSGLLVQAGRNAGLPADMIYGRLFLAFGVTLIAAVLVYALAPKGPRAA